MEHYLQYYLLEYYLLGMVITWPVIAAWLYFFFDDDDMILICGLLGLFVSSVWPLVLIAYIIGLMGKGIVISMRFLIKCE